MEFIDINDLKSKYSNCQTKSDSQTILLLYSYILKYERVDSDWWREDHGCNDVVSILERTFNDEEWNLFEEDIENWTEDQIELFILSILSGTSGNGIDEDEKVRNIQREYTLMKRADFLLKKKEIYSSIMLWDNIWFFEKIPNLSFEYLDQIAKHIGFYENLNTKWEDSDGMYLFKKILKRAKK
ncbi:hypothetical protein [Flavobacterium gelatinilyticum]|uniref:hypothetical protein n=1 Tax=Flavobacterium gelatinilyticum TaxID=3003260 RepID=UPI00247FFCA7|nr:hypothetical protein [Flavobacterium gelatinilyticum]